MARTATKDGVATVDIGYGMTREVKVFEGGRIPDGWEYDSTEGKTDEELTIEREKNLVERGHVDAASARTEVNQQTRDDDQTEKYAAERRKAEKPQSKKE